MVGAIFGLMFIYVIIGMMITVVTPAFIENFYEIHPLSVMLCWPLYLPLYCYLTVRYLAKSWRSILAGIVEEVEKQARIVWGLYFGGD